MKIETRSGSVVLPKLSISSLRECDVVAVAALGYLGREYKITRELDERYMDCSTVVSQSHWIGAAVQMPFIADSQRTASNALTVEVDALLPGDAVYSFRSHRDSPNGRYNHVALVLGPDSGGEWWTIESRYPVGVVLTPLADIAQSGGVRRFCPQPLNSFSDGEWRNFATRVPKLGRLGARLTGGYSRAVQRHSGTDIYLDSPASMVAPFSGVVLAVERQAGAVSRICIYSEAAGMLSCSGPAVRTIARLKEGEYVDKGEFLGEVPMRWYHPLCNCVPRYIQGSHVHWELWSSRGLLQSPAPGLKPPRYVVNGFGGKEMVAVSPIYAMKIGLVCGCFRVKPLPVLD